MKRAYLNEANGSGIETGSPPPKRGEKTAQSRLQDWRAFSLVRPRRECVGRGRELTTPARSWRPWLWPSLELTLNVNEIEDKIYGTLEQVLALGADISQRRGMLSSLFINSREKSGFELTEMYACRCQSENNEISCSHFWGNVDNSLHATTGQREREREREITLSLGIDHPKVQGKTASSNPSHRISISELLRPFALISLQSLLIS